MYMYMYVYWYIICICIHTYVHTYIGTYFFHRGKEILAVLAKRPHCHTSLMCGSSVESIFPKPVAKIRTYVNTYIQTYIY